MAYRDTVKLRAYTLFLQDCNFEETAKILRDEFDIKVSPNTVRNWSETPDANGMTWEDHRRRVRAVMRKNTEDVTRGKLAELQIKSETIQQKLYDQLVAEAAPKISSFEGAVYAFKTLAEFNIKMDVHAKKELNPLMIVQAMLEIFMEIPQVRKVLEQNWSRVQKEIQARIAGDEPKAIEITPEPDNG